MIEILALLVIITEFWLTFLQFHLKILFCFVLESYVHKGVLIISINKDYRSGFLVEIENRCVLSAEVHRKKPNESVGFMTTFTLIPGFVTTPYELIEIS